MTTPSDSESASTSEATTKITQDIDETQGQVIAQMMGGLAVGQLTVYLSQTQTPPKTIETATDSVKLGENPYQGLKAFREMDADRFFGRDIQIKKLLEDFQELHGDRTKIRVLPIYGPSGSGKSSLARAGLIPALGKQPLPGKDQGRLVVLTPGTHPLEALATVLARIATKDLTPVAKTRELKSELLQPNTQQEFDGLRRIADSFPDIDRLPLIILVDQFEELYTLCDDDKVRSAFVENLLCAASDSSQRVSVIITMRSDFLGKTQQHPRLNKLFSSQGFLVPIMQPEELAIAINEPAKQAGCELDKATVQLLVEQSKGQEGALPLLQFALTQIWEGLRKEIKPADTLEQIGGVGGALANEAKRLYESLNAEQQKIARSIFLALIQLNDDGTATRRRAPVSELITSEQDKSLVREVIERFARPGVWILVTFSVTFSNEQLVEMVEVAHEALIRKWQELRDWLHKHGENLRKKRKIEAIAEEWASQGKHKDYLLYGLRLQNVEEFLKETSSETKLSSFAKEFITLSIKQRENKLSRITTLLTVRTVALTVPLTIVVTLLVIHFQIISRAKSVLYSESCKPNPEAQFLTEYMVRFGYRNQLRGINLCNQNLANINLKGANLSEGNLKNSNLSGANLQNISLQDANLSEAYLVGADLTFAYLNKTILKEAKLEDANLRGVTLISNQLANVHIRGANMSGSHILNVNFLDADLSNVDLTDATIEEPINLSAEQISKAKLCRTILPEDIRVNRDKDCKK